MAKAKFHKGQKVYVRPVGTWASVERVAPVWSKGLDEPLKVTYDCGLGREFNADELDLEDSAGGHIDASQEVGWRVVRAPNRWQSGSEAASHPLPGTYPVVVTGEADWGGWRVPASEYALDPGRIERQARIVAHAPAALQALERVVAYARTNSEEVSNDLFDILRDSMRLLNAIKTPSDKEPAEDELEALKATSEAPDEPPAEPARRKAPPPAHSLSPQLRDPASETANVAQQLRRKGSLHGFRKVAR